MHLVHCLLAQNALWVYQRFALSSIFRQAEIVFLAISIDHFVDECIVEFPAMGAAGVDPVFSIARIGGFTAKADVSSPYGSLKASGGIVNIRVVMQAHQLHAVVAAQRVAVLRHLGFIDIAVHQVSGCPSVLVAAAIASVPGAPPPVVRVSPAPLPAADPSIASVSVLNRSFPLHSCCVA